MRSTLYASCVRKEWIPQPEHFFDDRAAPSSHIVRKRAAKIAEISAGIAPVPKASATNQGGRKGSELIMVVGKLGSQASEGRRPVAGDVTESMRLIPG